MRGKARIAVVVVLTGCSYPEFAFTEPPASETAVTDAPGDTTVVVDSRVDEIDSTPAETSSSDTAVADSNVLPDSVAVDSGDVAVDSGDVAVDTSDVAVDTGPPECTTNAQCPCAHVCVATKCVASDCTKDNQFCPSGRICTCVAGRLQISGTGLTTGGIVEAQPFKVSDNGADLVLRNYSLRDAPTGVPGMSLRPANCTSSWHYRNVVIQCVDIGDSAGGGIRLSRRTDPLGCRPATPPDLLIDQVTSGFSGLYLGFTDLEYKTVRVRKVTSKASVLFDTWGPGSIGELIIEDSPNLPGELQGTSAR